MDQAQLDNIAEKLDIKYSVLDNLKDGKSTYRSQIVLTNNSDFPLEYKHHWKIYFCHIRMVEPGTLPKHNEAEKKKEGVKFSHVNGCLFALEPLKTFRTLEKGESMTIKFKCQYYCVARTDLLPNWYIVSGNLEPRILKCTSMPDLGFVEPFDKPEKWKRFNYKQENGVMRTDRYDPYTPGKRFQRNTVEDMGKPGTPVLPSPAKASYDWEKTANFSMDNLTIYCDTKLENEALFLKEKLRIECKVSNDENSLPSSNVIMLKLQDTKDDPASSYKLSVNPALSFVKIEANDPVGAFYGIQSFLSILENERVPEVEIEDHPRFTYRGMHLDVSRNFHGKHQVMKLLDVMAKYKMNKFHFHLTDDEGWRLEIPGLEELTDIGSKRGHDLTERTCILPMLGSGPHLTSSGTGFYSVEDYQEILQFARRRHIEVIPEIDMPGHSHAAIMAMKARYYKYKKMGDIKMAEEFLLCSVDETLHAQSVQMFSENSVDPGLESTYRFVDKVVAEVQKIHEPVAPLQTFHFGGDEVPYETWEDSEACKALIKSRKVKGFSKLMEYFVKRVAKIVAKHDLMMGAWQDGVIHDEVSLEPVDRSEFPNKEVHVYTWQNVWESGLSGCAYRLANNGYKVVMAQGTHLYFDHPYEPDPEERGLYWACRFCDTRKTFGFMPDNIYANADVKLTGDPITMETLLTKHPEDHDPLEEHENILGMQGHLWTELVRTSDEMDAMIFPRLLAVAERSWHKASWEDVEDSTSRGARMNKDWAVFANSLGYRELKVLDRLGVAYHLTPPGARIVNGELEMNAVYPGLPLFYSLNDGKTWLLYEKKVKVDSKSEIKLMSKSADGKRESRIVILDPTVAET
ncbi:beta-hexosaminidase-like [Saccostrea cucullata]|uniref:beta-hexosaminidase-like n=1 Tax=Saccostrea cuccullata TaxID=36930 RepID=UPI002ED0FE0B